MMQGKREIVISPGSDPPQLVGQLFGQYRVDPSYQNLLLVKKLDSLRLAPTKSDLTIFALPIWASTAGSLEFP